jgi:hypothetical protein
MNKILSITRRVIPYVKELRQLEGVESIAACVVMQQLDFRFDSNPDGFYKFLEPCDKSTNPLYKDGDSWREELGMSAQEFRTAFDQIGVRYSSKTEFDKVVDKFQGKYYCSYHDKLSRLTYYFRNHTLIDSKLNSLVSDTTLYPAVYNPVATEIQPCIPPSTALYPDITDTTTDNTQIIQHKSKAVSLNDGSNKANEIEDSAYSLFLDWRELVEKPHIQWDSKGWRARRITKWLKQGYTFDDLRLAVRGMLVDEFLQKKGFDDIDWLCKDESSRIERYKGIALKKGLKPDEPIRKSNGYKRNSTTPRRDFAGERI